MSNENEEVTISNYPNLNQLPANIRKKALERSVFAEINTASALDWAIVCLRSQLVKAAEPLASMIKNSIMLTEISRDKAVKNIITYYQEMEKIK